MNTTKTQLGSPPNTRYVVYIETKIVREVTRIRLYFDFPTFSPDIPESNNTYRQFRQHPKPVKRILLPAKNILLIISLYSRVVL